MSWRCPDCGKYHSKLHLGSRGQKLCPHCGYGSHGYFYQVFGETSVNDTSNDHISTRRWYY